MVNFGAIIAAIICFMIAVGILMIVPELEEEGMAIATRGSVSIVSATTIAVVIMIGFGIFGFILLIVGLVSGGGKKEIIKEVIHTPIFPTVQTPKVEEKKTKKLEIGKNFCVECGKKLKSTDKFCPKCGTKVE
jgi:hypothetical protein